jgi:hypothetical protein
MVFELQRNFLEVEKCYHEHEGFGSTLTMTILITEHFYNYDNIFFNCQTLLEYS